MAKRSPTKTAAKTRPLDRQICFTLYATSMAITRAYKPLLDELGLTYPQYLVLCTLGEGGPMTVGAIEIGRASCRERV